MTRTSLIRAIGLGLVGLLIAARPPEAPGQSEAESLSSSFRKAAHRVLPAVVTVRPNGRMVERMLPGIGPPDFVGPDFTALPRDLGGSGVVIDAERGWVLTNDHVVPPAAPRVTVILPDGQERVVQEVRRDPRSDLALLVIVPQGLKAASWGDSDPLDTGDWVLAVGQPFGLSGTVTAGIVSGKKRGIGVALYEDLIQTDAAINPGNSGGPLVNLKGEVVGINTALTTLGGNNAGVGFAVPANRARRVAEDLGKFGQVRRSYIGVNIRAIDPATAQAVGQPGAVPVTGVMAGSPALAAGLQAGDVIVALQGQPVQGLGMLQAAIEFAPVGEPLRLTVVRDGQQREVTVRPEPVPAVIGGPEPPLEPGVPRVIRPGRRGGAPGPAAVPAPRTPAEGHEDEPAGAGAADTRSPGRFPELGLRLSEPTDALRTRFHLDEDSTGLVVVGVEPDGPADQGGLEIGMVITDAAGRRVGSLADFRAALARRAAGRDLVVRIRKGAKSEFRILPGGKDADPAEEGGTRRPPPLDAPPTAPLSTEGVPPSR